MKTAILIKSYVPINKDKILRGEREREIPCILILTHYGQSFFS